MKKFICAILTLSLAAAAFAREIQYPYKGQTLTYTVTDESNHLCATKTGDWGVPGNHVSGKLEIPATVSDGDQKYTVCAISKNSFINCDSLLSVTLPKTVTEIGNSAFCDCKTLKNIEILGPVTTIGYHAFRHCEKMMDIKLPETVKTIGRYCFEGCSWLSEIDIPPTMTTISADLFSGCSKLTVVHLPNTITTIEANAFHGCSWLPNIFLPSSVTSIGTSAFRECRSLKEIVIPNSITEIAPYTFADCTNLRNVRIGHGLKKIEQNAFRNDNITYLHITAQEPPTLEENALPQGINFCIVQGSKAEKAYVNGWKGIRDIQGYILPADLNIRKWGDVNLQAGSRFSLWASFNEPTSLIDIFWGSSDYSKAYVNQYGDVTILEDISDSDEVYIYAESLYAGKDICKFMLKHQPVESIANEPTVEEEAPMNVYNMQQSLVLSNATLEQVNRLPADIYIIRQGDKTFKKVVQ